MEIVNAVRIGSNLPPHTLSRKPSTMLEEDRSSPLTPSNSMVLILCFAIYCVITHCFPLDKSELNTTVGVKIR